MPLVIPASRAPKEIGSVPTRLPMRGRAEHRSVADRAAPASPRDALGGFLHDVPNRLYRHSVSPLPTLLTRRNNFPRSIALRRCLRGFSRVSIRIALPLPPALTTYGIA